MTDLKCSIFTESIRKIIGMNTKHIFQLKLRGSQTLPLLVPTTGPLPIIYDA